MRSLSFRPAVVRSVAVVLWALWLAGAPGALLARDAAPVVDLARKLDGIFTEVYAEDGPGAAVLVTRDGEVLLRKAYGMAHLELGVPLEPDMVFRLGSVTKQFTAVAILMLVEDGKLALGDPVSKHLADYSDVHGDDVTVEHLLTHTSGIPNYTDMEVFWETVRDDKDVDGMLDFFDEEELEFPPGTRWAYSNSGYVLLGALIEKVSGQPYAEFMRSRIFEPLGMDHTSYDDPERLIPRRVAGYGRGENGYANAPYLSMSQPYAAGALMSTVDDLARWNDSLVADDLLPKAVRERMWTAHRLEDGSDSGYGYGWLIGDHDGAPVIWHGGGIHGFRTVAIWMPEEKIFVAVLSNDPAAQRGPDQLGAMAASMAAGAPLIRQPVELAPESLRRYEGVYRVEGEEEPRVVTAADGVLRIQRGDGPVLDARPSSEREFFLNRNLTRIHFEVEEGGEVTGLRILRWGRPSDRAAKTDEPMPEPQTAVEVAPELLDRLVGNYSLLGNTFRVWRDGERMMTQMASQPEIEVRAASPTELFNETLGARLVFEIDGERASSFTLHQGGQRIEAPRVEDGVP